jgi:GrpB-like predicted nucleotidyltransferase (UPF0157 family)
MRQKAIRIEDYNPDWPGLFNSEEEVLTSVCEGQIIKIEHIGSTSIPALPAKPTIDIMAGVESLEIANLLIPTICSLGYEYISIYEEEMPERRYFVKKSEFTDLIHIHMVVVDSDFWRRHLAFRNYLRSHPESCIEYGKLKQELATEHGFDRSGYTDAKSEFIMRIQTLAGFIPTHAPNQSSDH